MIHAEKWWWGIVPLAVAGFAANYSHQSGIEKDLSERSAVEAGIHHLTTSVSGRDVILEGTSFDKNEIAQVAHKIDSVWGVRKVIDKTTAPPLAQPFILNIQNDGKTVQIIGNVSSTSIKDNLLIGIKNSFGSKEILDKVTFAAGAPNGFEDSATLAAKQLALLQEGTISFNDQTISVKGHAASQAIKDSFLKSFEALPDGMKLADVDISVSQSSSDASQVSQLTPFEAIKSDGLLTLKGSVPDAITRTSLLEASKRFFFKEKVVDELTINEHAPKNFMSIAMSGLQALSRLGNGSFIFGNGSAKISGTALYEKAISGIQTDVNKDLPEGFSFDMTAIETKPLGEIMDAATCQVSVNDLLKTTIIHFETDKAVISPYSAGLLDNIAATLARCSDAEVKIIGYTDATGDPDYNKDLSQRRAAAVLDHLAHAGLSREQFEASGLGNANPVASNDTEEGRSQNRRIEFLVK